MPDLIIACIIGSLSEVETIVKDGITDINKLDNDGSTALMWSLFYEHWSISEYLLSLDHIDTDVRNSYGDTALHRAC